jgi:hypothetical protein
MPKFIYPCSADSADPTGTTAFGVWFPVGEAVEVSEPAIVRKLLGNRFFEAVASKAKAVAPNGEPDAPGAPSEDAVMARGAAAKADGKKRNVPPAYRGKPEEPRWLAGYDGAAG